MDYDAPFRKTQEAGAVLLTTDRDFFHTVPHLHDLHCGVVVLHSRQPNRAAILSRLEWVLSNIAEGEGMVGGWDAREA